MTQRYRGKYCTLCQTIHEQEPNYERCPKEGQSKFSDLASPMVIMDTMPAVQSMVDGKMYTSKAALRATYKPSGNAEGKEYVEVGNDPARLRPFKRKKPDTKANVEAIKKAHARYDRGERAKNKNWSTPQGTTL